ncbi:uncharacterized protein [Physcomitrium patens]|uniref:uncharacterized protein isoform X2 n=1 Tax=Physcomitrium patens TaxID=3218 RepID=UPI000D15FA10|nr:splicing factor 3A subunit 2-like isoform X2 [Physcomitrium patens]|eukprot:XP_024385055.1 splicing factor 3A subunit 2-like isoform X2 [Physcomitrella patens]
MDRDYGSKPGSGGAASDQNEAIDRRERLRRLALETIDLAKDPYFMRNHLGSYECKLCLTLHNNEGNYLAHTQGKRHQTNLAKRAAREAKDAPAQPQPNKRKVNPRKTVKIGRPGYRVTKQFDQETRQRSLLFQIEYPEIEEGTEPRHRFMSSYEQVPSFEIDKISNKFFTHWDPDTNMFTLQLYFKLRPTDQKGGPPLGVNGPPSGVTPPNRPPPPYHMGGQAPGGPPMWGPPQRGPPPMSGPPHQIGGLQQNMNGPHRSMPPSRIFPGGSQMGGPPRGFPPSPPPGMRGPPPKDGPPRGFNQRLSSQGYQMGPPINQGMRPPGPPPPNMGQQMMHRPPPSQL